MEGYPFKVFETYQNKALNTELCPISPGQYVVCIDTGNIYYDSGENKRKQLTDVIDLETDAQRQAIVAPLDKLYFVKETCHLWRYVNGEWKDLLSGDSGTGTTNGIHIYDIGSAEFDPLALDFSQYAAGDVVLVVADMGGGEA